MQTVKHKNTEPKLEAINWSQKKKKKKNLFSAQKPKVHAKICLYNCVVVTCNRALSSSDVFVSSYPHALFQKKTSLKNIDRPNCQILDLNGILARREIGP